MMEDDPGREPEGGLPESQTEDNLRQFLAKRKLQISVLKKMLDQIPVPESGEVNDAVQDPDEKKP